METEFLCDACFDRHVAGNVIRVGRALPLSISPTPGGESPCARTLAVTRPTRDYILARDLLVDEYNWCVRSIIWRFLVCCLPV